MNQTNRVVVLLDDQMHERLRREAFERKLSAGTHHEEGSCKRISTVSMV